MNLAHKTTGSIASLRFVRSYPIRALIVWAAIHLFTTASTGQVVSAGFKGTIILAATAALVIFFDARRRRENSFLQNLGVHALLPPLLAAVTVIAGETALALFT